MTAAIFFEGGLIQLLLGGAFLLFTRRFWCWCYRVIGQNVCTAVACPTRRSHRDRPPQPFWMPLPSSTLNPVPYNRFVSSLPVSGLITTGR